MLTAKLKPTPLWVVVVGVWRGCPARLVAKGSFMKVISGFEWDVRPRSTPHGRAAGSSLPSIIGQGLRTAYDDTLTERIPAHLAVFVERLGQAKPDDIRIATEG